MVIKLRLTHGICAMGASSSLSLTHRDWPSLRAILHLSLPVIIDCKLIASNCNLVFWSIIVLNCGRTWKRNWTLRGTISPEMLWVLEEQPWVEKILLMKLEKEASQSQKRGNSPQFPGEATSTPLIPPYSFHEAPQEKSRALSCSGTGMAFAEKSLMFLPSTRAAGSSKHLSKSQRNSITV